MTPRLTLRTALAIALAIAPLFTGIAGAQTPAPTSVTLAPGEEKEICSGVKAAVTPAPKAGDLRTEGDPAGTAPVKIFYKAKDTTTAASDSLTCTVGNEKKEIKIAVTPKAARNTTTEFSEAAYPEAVKALFLLLVLATVLESALAILFNWRPFVETFNSRAVKPVVSFVVSLAVVYMFDLDLMTTLAKLIQPNVPPLDNAGHVLTAMVIAGGSAAVNNLMVGLGVRQARTAETVVPKPPPDKGWISVSIVRTTEIQGPVTVGIGVADGGGRVPVVASLEGSTRPSLRYFLRDPGRFPGSGGYAIKKGDVVTVKVAALKRDGKSLLEQTWGPNVMAEGAIVDLTFTMSQEAAVVPAAAIL